MASARITVERGVVGDELDYACAHIIIPASVNLLPIQAEFAIERNIHPAIMIHACAIYHNCVRSLLDKMQAFLACDVRRGRI